MRACLYRLRLIGERGVAVLVVRRLDRHSVSVRHVPGLGCSGSERPYPPQLSELFLQAGIEKPSENGRDEETDQYSYRKPQSLWIEHIEGIHCPGRKKDTDNKGK